MIIISRSDAKYVRRVSLARKRPGFTAPIICFRLFFFVLFCFIVTQNEIGNGKYFARSMGYTRVKPIARHYLVSNIDYIGRKSVGNETMNFVQSHYRALTEIYRYIIVGNNCILRFCRFIA